LRNGAGLVIKHPTAKTLGLAISPTRLLTIARRGNRVTASS
jgi:hypothetical protein